MSLKILVTGGAGFVGSHVAEFYAQRGEEVVVFDNLSRSKLLGKSDKNNKSNIYNWNYLKRYNNIKLIKGDIRESEVLESIARDVDVIIHTAAQTAVTTSVEDPGTDFSVNALGTFKVLEAARKSRKKPIVIYCSTNKVYGENVNKIQVNEENKKYKFEDEFRAGISETFPLDLCEHTPYGCSKLAGDLYVQDYGHLYGLKTGVFRMSCIYGPRQFGVEDQGWVAWFVIASILGKPITIYGDGKQVRDVLYIDDLVNAYDKFIESDIEQGVFNIGGGPQNTLSLLELLDILEKEVGRKNQINFADWRPSDQKVYISNISKARNKLKWQPKVNPEEGVKKLLSWVEANKNLFEE